MAVFICFNCSLQKLNVELAELSRALQTLSQQEGFGKSVRLDGLYWNVMKLLGFAYVRLVPGPQWQFVHRLFCTALASQTGGIGTYRGVSLLSRTLGRA